MARNWKRPARSRKHISSRRSDTPAKMMVVLAPLTEEVEGAAPSRRRRVEDWEAGDMALQMWD